MLNNDKWILPAGEYSALYNDLLSEVHLLIAGATGSGKSVVINGMMHAALFRSPEAAQFILIDPKRVELSIYKHLPHTLLYASEPDQFCPALDYALQIIESRYKAMQAQGLRKFSGGDVYIIIDEFADLMTMQKKHVVPRVQRIAQIGRAARVHLVIATQTPISKVLPTEIKCNFDSRIALRTRSAQDSRNILGEKCAEALPRYGYGYYMKPEGTTLYSLPMIPEAQIMPLVYGWQAQNTPPQKPRGFLHRLRRK